MGIVKHFGNRTDVQGMRHDQQSYLLPKSALPLGMGEEVRCLWVRYAHRSPVLVNYPPKACCVMSRYERAIKSTKQAVILTEGNSSASVTPPQSPGSGPDLGWKISQQPCKTLPFANPAPQPN